MALKQLFVVKKNIVTMGDRCWSLDSSVWAGAAKIGHTYEPGEVVQNGCVHGTSWRRLQQHLTCREGAQTVVLAKRLTVTGASSGRCTGC